MSSVPARLMLPRSLLLFETWAVIGVELDTQLSYPNSAKIVGNSTADSKSKT